MLASPSDFASAHHAAYQAVGRVLGRVTGSRAIEAVQDGFVVAVEVEGYDEPFEVAAGYEKRRGWVAELRDGTGRVWAVGAGARLPEAVASMGRAGNPPRPSASAPKKPKKHFLDNIDSAVAWAKKNSPDSMEAFFEDDEDHRGDYPPGYFEQRRYEIEELIDDYISIRNNVLHAGSAPVWRAIAIPAKADPLKWIKWDRIGSYWSFRSRGVGTYGFSPGTGPAYDSYAHETVSWGRVAPGTPHKTVVVEGVVQAKDIDWEHGFISYLSYPDQVECAIKKGAKVAVVKVDEADVTIKAHANPPPTTPHHWSSQGPASRKIYAKGMVPSTTKTSPHLKKLYRALLKHYTARVALTKKGRTWDEVAAILKIRPKGRPSVALWGKALAERVFYAKVRGLAFSKDMIGKLPRAERR